MIEIKQITTFDALYKSQGALTGNVLVDAVVDAIRHSRLHDAQELALMLGVDSRFLNKAMEVFVGLPLREMIHQWRVRQAVALLDDESLSYEEVARRIGYGCERSMISAFKKYFGTTPTIYREGTINQNGAYPMNADKSKLKKAQENAEALHQRDWK